MTFTQFRWDWNGWGGGPGVTLFRCQENLDNTQMDAAAAAQRVWFDAMKGLIPSSITITVSPTVSVIADGDGSLVEQKSIPTPPASVTGTTGANYSASSGACVVWKTNASTGRRLLQGRTFVVPLTSGAFDATGKLAAAVRTSILTASNTYVSRVAGGVPGHPCVWHRPVNLTGGFSAAVTSAQVNVLGASLKRRRD